MPFEEEMKESAAADLEASETPKEKLRNACLSRGFNGILSLGKLFRISDSDRSFSLSKDELVRIIGICGADLSDDEISELAQEFDSDGEGTIQYEEFLAAVRPEMNEERIAVLEEAFAALDEAGDGHVTMDDLKVKYKTAQHPKVLEGTATEEEILGKFLSRLEGNTSEDGVLTKNEFMDYYSAVGKLMDDDLFIELVRKSYLQDADE